MKRIGKFELISFTTGFTLLTYELAAARILAPSIGSSTYVWTSVIGVIIAALSAGFLTGGRLADARHKPIDVVGLLLFAAVFALITLLTYDGILNWVVEAAVDSRLQAVIAALVLFAPTSFFIGTTSPYLAKLKVTSLSSTGQAVASLDTFNAVGGILGTFTTGFILFGFIGSREAIAVVVLLLLVISWLLVPRLFATKRAVASFIILIAIFIPAPTVEGVRKIDTASAHYKVINGYYGLRPVTGLITGPGGTQSAVYNSQSNELVFWYTQQMAALTIAQEPQSVLVLGGGAFTLPQYLGEQLPNTHIDVVEIDPELLTISRDYFNYQGPSNVTEIFTDARTYVNTATKQYDVILVDVYGDASIPFSLMTREYGQAVGELLTPDGLLVANIIGGMRGGPCQQVLRALDAAYRTELSYAWYKNEQGRPDKRGNYVIAYSRTNMAPRGYTKLPVPTKAPYTDNYAPAERLYYDCQQTAQR
jgi:predicted membrane-bound spermidine synthase